MRASVRDVEIEFELTEPEQPSGSLPLVWGHGLSSSMADEAMPPVLLDWERLRSAFKTLRYDARGHGLSGFTTDSSAYGWDEMARDQLELVDGLGLERYALAGASMGAATALHAALLAPERVDRLVLVIPPTGWETRAEQTGMYIQMAEILETRGPEVLIAAGAATPPPDPFIDDEGHAERRAARMRAADPIKLAGLFRGAATADMPPKDRVAAIDVPTLILAWSGDPGHPVSSAELLTELMPAATLSVASTRSEFDTWTDQMLGFLKA